ncbi:hypothetical protein BJF79_11715 [Actinomadura sp. CNU-125]|uniref:hypothetical protein n=1 Tax=Actinomadura sp. CNU-125 TaxID=1904961 RepID=UPI00095D36A1|nr:hypothetical protein [Actinomadura sp. CNU-125]OLT27531.1 hypothetical protein BJF79_11715 [Actinomadura sp. CNU-125]
MSDALPLLLVDPPWERDARAYREATKAAAKDVTLVPGLEAPSDRSLVWAEGEREEWLKLCDRPSYLGDKEKAILEKEGWEGLVRAYQDGAVTYTPNQTHMFERAPEELVRPLLADWSTNPKGGWGPRGDDLKALLARFELDVHHIVFPHAKVDRARGARALLPVLDLETAVLMAHWFSQGSGHRIAVEWLTGHGADAVPFLVPDALAKARVPRDKARAALAHIASRHGVPAVVDAARRYGDDAAAAVEQFLTEKDGPKAEPPAKAVKPPKVTWLNRTELPEVRLLDGRVLPPAAIENLIGALTFTSLPWNATCGRTPSSARSWTGATARRCPPSAGRSSSAGSPHARRPAAAGCSTSSACWPTTTPPGGSAPCCSSGRGRAPTSTPCRCCG